MFRPLTAFVILVTMVCGPCGAHAYRRGDGTAYSGDYEKDVTGFNSCQFDTLSERWEKYYGALPSHVFDRKQHCGKCIRVRGTEEDAPGRWVTLMIVDECASCEGDGDVDMSKRALKRSTGYEWDRKHIEWEFTSCKTDGKGETDDMDSGHDRDDGRDR